MSERIEIWGKEWKRPTLRVYEPSDKKPRVERNCYGDVLGHGGATIGIAAVLFRRCWSLTWARPTVKFEGLGPLP